ncbi:conserved putative secreted protein [Candidatus Protochlamydia naegleriophila]|uniref:Conserved putative secreted protein n=1 Tax=Candidatus Protochlamydia naegleriophila TaxID=389348 RepID=A0A0U5JEF5_9BACT|nr:thioredoxin family protein [Candidatus Protochlamydia naegleriophila]CUI17194.1 conserved putative secreted protein [Candidatus Protochlamydia naegleriophila]
MKKIAALLLGSSLAFAAIPSLAFSQPFNQPYGQPTRMPNQGQPSQFGSQAYAAGGLNWLNNYQEAISQSQSSGKPIVILFTGTQWCPACMKLEREVLNKAEFAQAVGGRFIFLKAEFPDYAEEAISASPFRSLLDRYGIDAFPTMVVVDASGQRLYTVNYQAGGPGVYINELIQKLNPGQFSGRQMTYPVHQQPSNPYYR